MGTSKTSLRSTGGMSLKQQRMQEIMDAHDYACPKFCNPGTGADWKARTTRKKGKGSHTPGTTKNIRPTPLEKHFAKCSRSYKHRGYENWLRKTALNK